LSVLRVLVIDDTVADFDLINISMETALGDGVTLDHASTVDAAAALIGENDYSIILHDLFLPPSGPEGVLETYKIARNIPIIAMSGQSSPELHRTAVANGAKLFCRKSDLDGDNIASILSQILPAFGPEGR
jgi:DNA-binding NtrC family response regulator